MSTTATGQEAEELVVAYLKERKHKIVSRNWRTKRCEIDIVSVINKRVYFTEVKFRSSDAWGDGLEYITPKKLKQMHFAAELWLAQHDWSGESVLLAAAVDRDGEIKLIEL